MAKVTKENIKSTTIPPNMKDRYTARIVKAESTISQTSQQPMVHLECEVVWPQEKKFGDKVYVLDGLTFHLYFPTRGSDPEKTERNQAKYFAFREALRLDPEFDDENPDVVGLEGLVFDVILDSRERIQTRKNPESGKWEPILDGENKPISTGWEITPGEVLGPSSMEVNRPY